MFKVLVTDTIAIVSRDEPTVAEGACKHDRSRIDPLKLAWQGPEQRCATAALVTGDEDSVAPPQQVRALAEKLHAAKSTRVVVLPKCGHWTPIERPEECAREVRDFLASQR